MYKGPRSKFSVVFTLLAVAAVIFGAFTIFRDMQPPDIYISHDGDRINLSLPVTVVAADAASSIKSMEVAVRFQENLVPIVKKEFSGERREELTFTLADSGLKNNDVFDLEISAVDSSFGGLGFGNKNTVIIPMRLDTSEPRMTVNSSVPYVRRGGTGCVVYSVSKEVTRTGVKVGELFFPAFRQENGDYLCFFAFPHYLDTKDFNPLLTALDKAGNQRSQALDVTAMPRRFNSDTIVINRSFLDSKAAEFTVVVPEQMSDIERFLVMNGRIRRANAATLMETGKITTPEMLWKGAFQRMPKAASRAGFADHRTYLWEGKKVDEQTHMGFDLASVKHADVPAANFGTVVYAGYLGIYGNLIVIDHGLGLQSLYSHLSEIGVEPGRQVKKGEIIGKTGSTGMAGGDHLHFGILVSGLEVTPLEWLDDHWIKDNIIDRIKDAGGRSLEFQVNEATAPQVESGRPAPEKPGASDRKPSRRSRMRP
ncbi:MAG: M23 family metallopeptidase [Desulfovibrio sp.]|jgi:murein DD-endopeptidase MepM/ murein hydrolase activator NlpD|nr:M23 family metallopeptidase [Desulfovibrio sp.]